VLGLADEAFRHGRTSELDAICLHDLRLYLPDDILVKVDRMSMAVSLEVRVPILDHHVVEWGARLPARLRVNGGTLKYLLKKLLERYMPPEHVHRDKMGFGVPLDRWFRCELKDLVEDRLCDSEIRRVGVLRPSAVRYLLRRHQSGSRNFESLLWRIFVIQTWMVNHA
jgi:asparagine synthase (glutamine-hydrolysing)